LILTIDVVGKEFLVTKTPRPQLDHGGEQRKDKENGKPLWGTQVSVIDDDGGEIITINTSGMLPPEVTVGDYSDVVGLVAIPWNNSGRSGVAYRADDIKPVDD
jgi:hypothetical protein